MSFNLADPCLWCIDGNTPAGIHGVLNEVYRPCPVCLIVCDLCEGEGLFPAEYTCLHCLTDRLARLGLAPVLCAHCLGVIDLIPRDTTQEATCDVEH
ncbi:hypothetical protein [Polymorphospora lycopeni]|uniref:Uncharacterized protein n=1 Tax=Polymorphospora lycopeni TaxID=3140240 RepID=A0ABV5CVZ1_9ACTN